VFFSSQVESSSGRQNLLMLREALALGIQKGITIEQVPAESLSTKIAAHVLFGVKTYNEGRACKITTATS
jgi:electron transfer flavoprotein alpha/beta subunit